MKTLILSNRHFLLPLADSLTDYHDVQVIVLKDRYESCWEQRLPKLLKGKQKSIETYKKIFGGIKEEEGVILTDSRKMTELAQAEGCRTFGVLNSQPVNEVPNIMLLGWFDGEQPQRLALAVPDWGLWPSGMGPFVLAGLTVSRWKSAQLGLALGPLIPTDAMKSDNFRGIFAIHLKFDGNGFQRLGYSGGWMPIISHSYLADADLTAIINGGPVDADEKMHVVSLPVSIPPYPLECNYKSGFASIDPALMGQPGIAFHDLDDTAEDGLRTAGTDGLVSVVTSTADRFTKARHGALTLASQVRLPQVQWRADVGSMAERMFDLLESYGL